VVFYNGDRNMPEEQILKLSDAFDNKEAGTDLELQVRMLNINYGHNGALMKKCRILGEYSEFVAVSKSFVKNSSDWNTALNNAIDYCIEHHILEEFLTKYRQEVLGMLLEQFDVKKYERSLREEGWEDGLAAGREQGLQAGREQGLQASINICLSLGISDDQIISNLMKEFSLSQEDAKAAFEKYCHH
jgi:hypothetical protein